MSKQENHVPDELIADVVESARAMQAAIVDELSDEVVTLIDVLLDHPNHWRIGVQVPVLGPDGEDPTISLIGRSPDGEQFNTFARLTPDNKFQECDSAALIAQYC